jgi:hypothetical protein
MNQEPRTNSNAAATEIVMIAHIGNELDVESSSLVTIGSFQVRLSNPDDVPFWFAVPFPFA